jgi:hypothetical protein
MKEMTCREFDEVVHGFVRVELLDVNLREAAIEHAAHCRSCAERMVEAGVLSEVTDAAAVSVREQHAPPHVEAALLSAFRNQRRRTIWWRTLEWAGAGIAAAVLAVVLWNSLGPSKGQPSPAPRKDVSSQPKRPLDASARESSQPEDSIQGADLEGSNTAAGATYSLSDFVPVPYTDAMGPEDPGMVVRVQLTRASLAELGYPVAATPDEDLIRADVLVGEDGWPRGVRVVQ